jgi:exoribonuclease-2
VVLEVKNKRLRLLTENNREVNLSAARLSHSGEVCMDTSMGRDQMVDRLKHIAMRRHTLIRDIDIQELWEVLNSEQEWIDLRTMTEFCFPGRPNGDHESAVVRAFFQDRLYFKFNPDRFFPNSEAKVEQIAARNRKQDLRERMVEQGSAWLRQLVKDGSKSPLQGTREDLASFRNILKSCYLFGKDSMHMALGKAMMARAGVGSTEHLFPVLVHLGVFTQDENIDIHRLDVPVAFSENVLAEAAGLVASPMDFQSDPRRRDLTDLSLMTIDGQSTLDFDDALSIEIYGGRCRLGVHISDVSHFIQKGSLMDEAAADRGSSIYTPDQKIPMLPSIFAEGQCSLKAEHLRPAISLLIDMDADARITDWEIVPSLVRVRDQLTYYDVNMMADDKPEISLLCRIAESFRRDRLAAGAVQITLPEIHVWVGDDGEITVNRVNRESPGRRLVAEIMIMANWLMAQFLAEKGLPAIFRSQADPRERLYTGEEGTLFQNYMQRRLLNRFVLSTEAEPHSGLGLDAYVTATSPIRKYFDLVTQRQLRAAFGMETSYSTEDIEQLIQHLEQPMSRVSTVQRSRNRYWLLKYLETQIGAKEEAIVLAKRRNTYQILLLAYMLECELPASGGIVLKPEDLVQVTLQQVDARKDRLCVFMG